MVRLNGSGSMLGAACSTVGASLCCVVPLVLLALGIGGSWIGSLTAMEPYQPFFIALTLLFLGLAFRRLYVAPQSCAEGAACAETGALRRQRLVFWIVTALLLGVLAFPWLAPLFY